MKESLFPQRQSVAELDVVDQSAALKDVEQNVQRIVESVRRGGETALRKWSAEFDQMTPGDQLYFTREALDSAADRLPADDLRRLSAVAERIRSFARAQKDCLVDLDIPVPGGRAGHRVFPVERAGCYVPSGRHPLPSSVLMTVIPARVAGVESVWIASPRPDPFILAAASVADADGLLAAGGAQAIAALAFGSGPLPPSDVIVGPGNRYVTAAKKLLSGEVRIDMLAGPSELVIIADDSSDPALVAADLLAQAEHDHVAVPVLVSLSDALAGRVEVELASQLASLPTRTTAAMALKNGGWIRAADPLEAAEICNTLAPEHLQVSTLNPELFRPLLHHYGALFLGESSAEVFGDYGIGPNHVLPTGKSARTTGGLSVLTFLRIQTWLELDAAEPNFDLLASESAWLARVEGLEAHARALEKRNS